MVSLLKIPSHRATTWENRKTDYLFEDNFEKLRESVSGATNSERFDYWLNSFKYLREVGKFGCSVGEINRLIAGIKKDSASFNDKVFQSYINLRIRQVNEFEKILFYLVKTINTTGESGTLTNWQQHNYPRYVLLPDMEFKKIAKKELPASCYPSEKDLNNCTNC